MKHISIRISGKVQGVFYRASTQAKADELGVKGFVRNEPNGDVYVEAEGTEEQLNKLLAWCKVGPPRAKVDRVETQDGAVLNFKRFEVRR